MVAYLLGIVDFYIIGINQKQRDRAGIRGVPPRAGHGFVVAFRLGQLIILFQNLRSRSLREFNFQLKVK